MPVENAEEDPWATAGRLRDRAASAADSARRTARAAVGSARQTARSAAETAKRTAEVAVGTVQTGARVPGVGRNDPCPCGSGKKYKKCCARNAVGS